MNFSFYSKSNINHFRMLEIIQKCKMGLLWWLTQDLNLSTIKVKCTNLFLLNWVFLNILHILASSGKMFCSLPQIGSCGNCIARSKQVTDKVWNTSSIKQRVLDSQLDLGSWHSSSQTDPMFHLVVFISVHCTQKLRSYTCGSLIRKETILLTGTLMSSSVDPSAVLDLVP